MREATVELGAREAVADREILHREAINSGDSFGILAREQGSEIYARGVRVLPPLTGRTYLTRLGWLQVTGETNIARDPQDLEPRICPHKGCL